MGLTKTFGCYTVWTGACLSVVELLLSFCAALGFGLEKFWVGLAIAVVAVVFLFVELYGLSAQKFGIIVAIGIFRFLGALTSLVGLIYVIAANKFDIYGDMFGPPSYNINYHYDDSSFKMVTSIFTAFIVVELFVRTYFQWRIIRLMRHESNLPFCLSYE